MYTLLKRPSKYIYYIFLTALIPFSSYGFEYHILNVTNDEDKEHVKLYLKLDKENEVQSLHTRTFSSRGEVVASAFYDAARIFQGIVLEKQKAHNVIVIRSPNFSRHLGGDIILDYLYNGITGSRKHLELSLETINGRWAFLVEGKEVRDLHVVSHKKILIGTVGIKTIKF